MPVGDTNAFDPVKFKTDFTAEIMTEVNKAVNGATKGLKTDMQKSFDDILGKISAIAAPVNPNPNPDAPNPDAPTGDAKTIAEMNGRHRDLEKQIKGMAEKVTKAEQEKETERKARIEQARVSAFDSVVSGFEFATPKAKDQFRRAYQGRVEYDADNNLIVKDDKGEPVLMDSFLKAEYDDSPHFQPAQNRGGSGVTNTTGGRTAPKSVYDSNMTPAQINALPPEQRAELRQQVANMAQATLAGTA